MVPDALFAHPRLAAVYDRLEGERPDLDHYVALVAGLGARTVLDVGCGTGSLAVRLAATGLQVTGVDPAAASLAVARSKPGADRVRWIEGTAGDVGPVRADLAIMTGNVAQVFVTDEAWTANLEAIALAVVPGGSLVFETRDPERRAWERWTMARTRRTVALDADEGDGATAVETWHQLVDVAPPLVTFATTFAFDDGSTFHSTSTLRFRSREEIEASLNASGFDVIEVRDAPDRPGLEFVFVARRRRPGDDASAGGP